jgi:hypothetical protein
MSSMTRPSFLKNILIDSHHLAHPSIAIASAKFATTMNPSSHFTSLYASKSSNRGAE